jgi:hypothetical protein
MISVTTETEGSRPEPSPAQMMEALSYQAPFLIEKLLKERIVDSAEQAQALFTEAIKYLILNRMHPGKQWMMISRLIDEAWHQFVLFTVEYSKFCVRYFGMYLHHAPGNDPNTAARPPSSVPTVGDFRSHYEQVFGMPLPEIWHDATAIRLNQRILISDAGGALRLDSDEPGMVTVRGDKGAMVSVSELARTALEFALRTKAFYVRELPGDLTDDEKLGLVDTLVKQHVCSLGV